MLFIEDAVGAILLFSSEIKQLHLVNNRRVESHSSNVTASKDGLLFMATFLTKKRLDISLEILLDCTCRAEVGIDTCK